MKKVLISMLLVLLTLCLFVSCSSSPKVKEEPTPTTKTITVYKYDNLSTPFITFEVELNNENKWSDYTIDTPYISKDVEFYCNEYSNYVICYSYTKLLYTDKNFGNLLNGKTKIKDCPTPIYFGELK